MSTFHPSWCSNIGCPEPDLCRKLKRHLHNQTYHDYQTNPVLRAKWLAEANLFDKQVATQKRSRFIIECIHLGEKLSGQPCGSALHKCNYDNTICSKYRDCTEATRTCVSCPHRKEPPDKAELEAIPYPIATVAKKRLWRFNEFNLHPGFPGKRFNPSLIEYGDGYLLAWRHGWEGCEVLITRLDRNLKPQDSPPIKLDLNHAEAMYGREDPRFFWFKGQLHVMYVGVTDRTIGKRRDWHTSVLYARLDDKLKVERVFYPIIQNRNSWEKNHAYFEHKGELFAVYSYHPHRILKIDGDKTEWVYQTPSPNFLSFPSEVRGGPAPVHIGDEWWHFYHTRIEIKKGRQYCMGLYTFEDKQPFAVKRFIRQPLMWADFSTKPADQYCAAVFPCGAVLRNGKWLISMGIHDRWGEIWEFDHAELESKLES